MLTDDERLALRDIADRLDHLTHSKLIAEQSAKLRAIAAPRVATVGELLATHIKAIRSRDVVIECFDGDLFAQISYEEDVIDTLRGGEHHQTVHNYYAERTFDAGPWSSADAFYGIDEMIDRMNLPARLVSAEHADDSPATRGPIGEG